MKLKSLYKFILILIVAMICAIIINILSQKKKEQEEAQNVMFGEPFYLEQNNLVLSVNDENVVVPTSNLQKAQLFSFTSYITSNKQLQSKDIVTISVIKNDTPAQIYVQFNNPQSLGDSLTFDTKRPDRHSVFIIANKDGTETGENVKNNSQITIKHLPNNPEGLDEYVTNNGENQPVILDLKMSELTAWTIRKKADYSKKG